MPDMGGSTNLGVMSGSSDEQEGRMRAKFAPMFRSSGPETRWTSGPGKNPQGKQTVRKRDEEEQGERLSEEQTERQTTAPDISQNSEIQKGPDRKRRRVESPSLSEGLNSGIYELQTPPKSHTKAEPVGKLSKAEKNQAKLSLSITTERNMSVYFSPSRGKVGPNNAPRVGFITDDHGSSLICEGSNLKRALHDPRSHSKHKP